MIETLLSMNNLSRWADIDWHLGWNLQPFTQSLAEEIVFRAFLLRYLLQKSQNDVFTCLLVALVFTLCHLVFFPISEGAWLDFSTLVTIFSFGLATNLISFQTRAIWILWGIHAGLNAVKFRSDFAADGRLLSEAEAFNLVEGSGWSVLISSTLAVVAIVWMVRFPMNRDKVNQNGASERT